MATPLPPSSAGPSVTRSSSSSTPTSSTLGGDRPSTSTSPPDASSLLSPHFSPLIHTFTTPELTEILHRSRFNSLSHLLSTFESNIDKVQVRSTNYEARLLPKFGVKLVERALPPAFASTTNQGATSSLGSGVVAPPPPPGPGLVPSRTTWGNTPTLPTTPFLWPTQAERDELFLDSLSSLITGRLQSHWTSHLDAEMPVQRPTRPRRRIPTDEEIAQDPSLADHPPDGHDQPWDRNGLDSLTPWYTTMRDEVFKRREMSEQDSFNSPIACEDVLPYPHEYCPTRLNPCFPSPGLLALSSSHPDPLNALSALWDLTSKSNLFSPRAYPPRSGVEEDSRHEWANPDVLRYIVLVHDHGAGGGRDALEDAKDLHEQIRKTYGHHTALLPIFTAAPTAAKPEARARGIVSLWDEAVLSQPGTGAPAHSQAAAIVGLGVDQERAYEVDSTAPSDDPSAWAQPASPLIEIGHELSDLDFNAIKVFLREMVVQSIVPWIERSVVVGYEQYQASKKSIGGRLFSAGRKYFGGGGTSGSAGKATTNAAGQAIGYNAAKGYYPFISQEAQSRRLADLLFILHDFKLASTIYESLLKDYRADRASRHYASACRMMGLCLLLSHPTGQALTFNPDQYLEMAGASSSTTVDLDGLKAMMFYYEVYLAIPDLRPAPTGLVRTAGEAEEITSAVLLEQAALADLRLPRAHGGMAGRNRKFGFHMIMAAKRYEKCGVKSLSRRCLNMTRGIYRGVGEGEVNADWWRDDVRYETFHDALGVEGKSGRGGWDAVTNHLEHTLARQAYSVGKPIEAVGHFLELIKGQNDDEDGEEWLDDFALAWERLSEQDRVEGQWISPKRMWKVLGVWTGTVGEGGSGEDEEGWATLEKEVGATESGTKARSKNDAGFGGELRALYQTFYLELLVTNPLNASLAVGGVQISSDSSSIEMEAPQEIELSPRETKRIYVPMRAHQLGPITFTHISYRFIDLLPCVEELQGRRKRLNATPEQQKGIVYTDDRSMLTVEIRAPVPSLSIDLKFLPQTMYAGELKATSVRVTNIGHVALVGLQTMCDAPSFARFVSLLEADNVYATVAQAKEAPTTTKIENRLRPNATVSIPLGEGQKLGPGESVDVPLVLRGDASGVRVLKWVFAFKGEDSSQVLTSRATHRLEVLPSIEIRPLVQPSSSPSVPFLLSFEVHNQHIPGDLVISQIASLSPRWAVSMLPNVAFDNQFGPVSWQQSMSVVLAVHPVKIDPKAEAKEDGHAFAVKQLNLLLQGRDVDKASPGDVTLHHASVFASSLSSSTINTTSSSLLPSLLRTHTVLRHDSLSTQFRTIDRALHPHLFPLFNPRSLDLVIFWSSPSLDLQGHHHLADIPFGAGSNVLKSVLETAELKAGGLYAESQRERTALLGALRRSEMGVQENAVSVMLQVDENLVHDFGKGPCTVPVTYQIRNLSPSQAFDYTLILAPSETRSTTSLVYSGSLTHRGLVPPLGLGTVATQLWIMRQGIFDVGGWTISVKSAAGDERTLVGPRRDLRVRDEES
ncbi:BZ3500_MvSof-1268-A1-R1_Chr1-3g02288 [Microbotryum saponariae]|uniref:BZ3500_MvSof-1268-A1-R1_Chr1-3g02288 protein n=1 Tax=Microbotryum saponariae TaxID=289078 RepID=A0A2X0MTK3_9BASI|nr:BZ3500_MvSof-1268-A1-R1_Chr1-3g02288 [Microbotryum saponariae]SCZ95884.1 BZ3501_MvSof-1269-A2-R1_Chr1-3g01891 [Microbotryum saponariae]